MGEVLTVLSDERQLVQADANNTQVVTNGGGGTVYYGGAAVTTSSNDGNLTVGSSVTLTTAKHFISASRTNISVATVEERGLEPLDVRVDVDETAIAALVVADAALAAADKVRTANTQTVAYTLALTDAGKAVEINSADALILTVPLNATIAFPTGSIVEVVRLGAGSVTIAGEGAVITPNVVEAGGTTDRTITTQYGSATLRKRGTNEWVLTGGIS